MRLWREIKINAEINNYLYCQSCVFDKVMRKIYSNRVIKIIFSKLDMIIYYGEISKYISMNWFIFWNKHFERYLLHE